MQSKAIKKKVESVDLASSKKSNLYPISKWGLFIFFLSGLVNISSIAFNSIGKEILYEDSFYLISESNIPFWDWLFIPHNGHPIALLRIVAHIINIFIKPFGGYNIIISWFILIAGIIVIYKYLSLLIEKKNIRNIVFLTCSILWISPWQWENLIWEFQVPWFLISFLVICLSLIQLLFYLGKDKGNRTIYIVSQIYVFFSPIISIISSGQGICYLLILFIASLYNRKIRKSGISGIILSILILTSIRISNQITTVSGDHTSNIISFLIHFSILFFTIIKAPISAFNSSSGVSWIIPILSSIILEISLLYYCMKGLRLYKIKLEYFIHNGSILPLIFALSFGLLTSISRSGFGVYQSAVSRYLTCSLLLPIGFIWMISTILIRYKPENTNSYKFNKNNLNINNYLFKISSLFLILLIINSPSYFLTILQSQTALNQRIENFSHLNKACVIKLNSTNQESEKDIIRSTKEIHRKMINKVGSNTPPLPGSDNFDIFNKNLTYEFCKKLRFKYSRK